MRTEEETYQIRKLRMIIEVKHKETFRFEDRDEQKYRRALFVCVFFCSHFPGTGTAKRKRRQKNGSNIRVRVVVSHTGGIFAV